MEKRPCYNVETFKEQYHLKKELVAFCKENHLQTTGGKLELTERIITFLETGKRISKKHTIKKTKTPDFITNSTVIEENFVCTQKHRKFYKEQIGKQFSFNVQFQKWLKRNAGKTYQDSIDAYRQIIKEKKKTPIDKQFEYNTYIRDFFKDNKDKTLKQAIQCWNYKKSIKGANQYEKEDGKALQFKNT